MCAVSRDADAVCAVSRDADAVCAVSRNSDAVCAVSQDPDTVCAVSQDPDSVCAVGRDVDTVCAVSEDACPVRWAALSWGPGIPPSLEVSLLALRAASTLHCFDCAQDPTQSRLVMCKHIAVLKGRHLAMCLFQKSITESWWDDRKEFVFRGFMAHTQHPF